MWAKKRKGLELRNFETISNQAEYADHRSPDVLLMGGEAALKPATQEGGSLFENLFELIDLAAKKPEVWTVLKIKLRNPFFSSRQIASECSVCYRTVQNHLNEAGRISPALARICGGKMKSTVRKVAKPLLKPASREKSNKGE